MNDNGLTLHRSAGLKSKSATNFQGHVLIVDDDVELVARLRGQLVNEGFEVTTSYSLQSGMEAALSGGIDLAVLDVLLPDGSGVDLLRAIRSRSSVPVLLLKTKGDAADRVLGLEFGADDYLSKPFDQNELIARVHAVLRRMHRTLSISEGNDWIRVGELALSAAQRRATYSGKELNLTSMEFNLLEHLLRRCGTVVSREELVRIGLGRAMGMLDRSVDVHLSRLRKKLAHCGAVDEQIKSVRGAGYMLVGHCIAA